MCHLALNEAGGPFRQIVGVRGERINRLGGQRMIVLRWRLRMVLLSSHLANSDRSPNSVL